MKKLIVFCISYISCTGLYAQLKLAGVFADSMVLQRNVPIPVWGWASKNETIRVQLNNQVKKTRADKTGKWQVKLDPEQAGGPYHMTVKGKQQITIGEVLIGDVWLCSGQSNMEWILSNTDSASKEISSANYPQIRHFLVPKNISSTPLDDIKPAGNWKAAVGNNVAGFTAVGYYFAKELNKELNVPIGLLHTSWGGTHVETWTSREAFQNSNEFSEMISNIPSVNLDSMSKVIAQRTANTVNSLQGGLPDKQQISLFSSSATDHSNWPVMKLPGAWESQSLKDFDGVVWFRKQFKVSSENAGKPAKLSISMIDDIDSTYVNGKFVGSMNVYNAQRIYTIPAGVLKEGMNVIAIRVEDTGGGGGMTGEESDMNIVFANGRSPLAGDWNFQVASIKPATATVGPNSYPSLLYNAMIHPLIPFAIKGALWYQGESNAGRAFQYRKAFPLMITDWRSRWNQGDFPFYFVQLATFNSNNGTSANGSSWAELREAQALTLKLPNTGMAVTTDIGNPKDIHPRNKLDVGKRLAAVALNKDYQKNNVYAGPTYSSMKQDGNKMIISFDHIGGGLLAKDKYGYLKGFEIAGANQQFFPAKAFIEGNSVVVYQDNVNNPVAVRYSWADDASESNLFNKDGFPAAPFRTDTWKGITESARFMQ